MKRGLSAAASLASLGLLAAIGLFVSNLTGCYWLASYQDLTSAVNEGGLTDADPNELDAGSDAGADADADASADATVPSEAGPFCPADAGPYTYCMDFDGVDSCQVVLTPSSGGSITDASGSVWTLSASGDIEENGAAVPGGGGTSELIYVVATQLIWGRDASSGNWYSWNGTYWDGPSSEDPVSGSSGCGGDGDGGGGGRGSSSKARAGPGYL
jgi:hypothetical protein